jgi:hypothetical protein
LLGLFYPEDGGKMKRLLAFDRPHNMSIRLHCLTSQKSFILIFTVGRTTLNTGENCTRIVRRIVRSRTQTTEFVCLFGCAKLVRIFVIRG